MEWVSLQFPNLCSIRFSHQDMFAGVGAYNDQLHLYLPAIIRRIINDVLRVVIIVC